MLVEITSLAEAPGAELEARVPEESSGKTSRFDVPITSSLMKIRRTLPSSQRKKDTGIVEIAYAGSTTVSPDEVRLRAADGKSKLVRKTATLTGGVLHVDGTITTKAAGVVRIRLEHNPPDGSTAFLDFKARIAKGEVGDRRAPARAGVTAGQLSIQFTGYEKENLRGEQTGKQVP